MALLQPVKILGNKATQALFPLAARSAQSTIQLLSVDGNSLLSSVFVLTADAGTTVEVKYFQTSSGTFEENSERADLTGHRVLGLANAGETDQILATRIHNKPACEINIVGPGTITFGVYVSVRSETASDLDSALHLDDEVSDLLVDKGIPTMCYDEVANKWFMLRCVDGALSVGVSGSLTANETTDVESGTETVTYNTTETLISYTPAANTRLHQIVMGGDGSGEFVVKIGTTVWATVRNAWNERQVILPMGGKLVGTSDTITIDATNITPAQSGDCLFEAYIHRGGE
jgi:hypothetical protein